MLEFFCVALLAGCFLLLSVIADVLSRIHEILDCEDCDKADDGDWPEPDPNH